MTITRTTGRRLLIALLPIVGFSLGVGIATGTIFLIVLSTISITSAGMALILGHNGDAR